MFKTFSDIGQYPHDSNLTLNVLLMVIDEIARLLVSTEFQFSPSVPFICSSDYIRDTKYSSLIYAQLEYI